MRIRVPDQWWGDYLAMLGAARIGEREILALGDELGWSARRLYPAMVRLQRTTHGRGDRRHAERARPHDQHPRSVAASLPDGITTKADVTVDSAAARIEVDLTDNPDCLPFGLNLSEACARTAAMVGVFNSLPQSVPANAGSFRRIEVHLRENCIVGIPHHPTSSSVATTNLADRVTSAVQRAIAEIADARHGRGRRRIPPASGVISGSDPRHGGAPFVNELFLAGGGGPGTAARWLADDLTMGNAGMPFHDSVEVDELRHPIRIETRRLVPDSEGAGTFRGAPGGSRSSARSIATSRSAL